MPPVSYIINYSYRGATYQNIKHEREKEDVCYQRASNFVVEAYSLLWYCQDCDGCFGIALGVLEALKLHQL